MYLLNKILNIDKKAMSRAVGLAKSKSGKSKLSIFLDMVYSGFVYQAGYNDYVEFEFYKMSGRQRRTYLTQGKNNKIIRCYNDPALKYILDDKIEFNKKFDKYLNRGWLDIRSVSYDEFEDFLSFHKKVVGKIIDGEGGVGVDIYDIFQSDKKTIYDTLMSKKEFLIEEYIDQHSVMSKLYPGSVNTLRLFTFCKDGQSHYLNGILKTGNGGTVDNFTSGGMYSFVNENGIVDTPAIDKKDNEYIVHPITGVRIKGFWVPLFHDAVELVKAAHKEIQGIGYIGWDVAIGENGPMIVEGNFYPGIFQKKASYSNGEGLLLNYRNYMKI